MSQPPKSTSPFVVKRIICPACNKENEHRTFRRNMFVPNKVENDQHVVEYRWLNTQVERFHPPHYFIFFCPNCYYSDTSEDFAKPFDTDFGAQVLKSFKRANDFQSIIIESLGGHITYGEDISFESAVYLHVLALHQQLMPPEDLQDTYKMARIALRTGWLFRENKRQNGHDSDPVEEDEDSPAKAPSLLALKKAVKEFEEQIGKSMRLWPPIESALERRVSDIQGGIKDRENPYAEVSGELPALLKDFTEKMFSLKSILARDESGGLSAAKQEVSAETHEEMGAFMKNLKDYWPDLPLTEREATNMAIEWFRKAIETDSRLGSHETYTAIATLVTNLLIRKGDLRSAAEMVRGMYQSGVDSRTQYQEKIKDPALSNEAQTKMQQKLMRVNQSIEEAADFRDQIIELMMKKYANTIREVFSQAGGQTREVIQAALAKKGVPSEVIARLKKPGGPLAASR